jgi:hypothetical protein
MPIVIKLLNDRVHTGAVFMVLVAARAALHNGVGFVYEKDGKPVSLEVALNHLAPDLGNVCRQLAHMSPAAYA